MMLKMPPGPVVGKPLLVFRSMKVMCIKPAMKTGNCEQVVLSLQAAAATI